MMESTSGCATNRQQILCYFNMLNSKITPRCVTVINNLLVIVEDSVSFDKNVLSYIFFMRQMSHFYNDVFKMAYKEIVK